MRSSPSPTPIVTHRIDSAALPVETQFAAFASHTRNSRVSRPGPPDAPFALRARFWTLEGMTVSEQHADPFNFDRDEALVHATGADHYLLVCHIEGSTRFLADGTEQLCGPGQAVLADLTRPVATCSTRQHSTAINIARPHLQAATGRIDAHGLLPDTAETRLLHDFLRTAVGELETASIASAAMLSHVLRDLLANALSHLPAARATATARAAQRRRAEAYLDAHPPATLDVRRMAEDLGLARSSLFRLFETDGGVATYLRTMKLKRLHRAISLPGEARSFAELGFAHGFEDPAHLARLFRDRFGYSMGALRARLSPLSTMEGAAVPLLYRDAIENLSVH